MYKCVLVVWVHLTTLSLGYGINQADTFNEGEKSFVDLIIEKDLYLALAKSGLNSKKFSYYLVENENKNQCRDISLISHKNLVYAFLKDNQNEPISISKCENFNKFVGIIAVNVGNSGIPSKEEFVKGVHSYVSQEIGRKVLMGMRIVIKKDNFSYGYINHVSTFEDYKDLIKDFRDFAQIDGILNAINLFYLAADLSLFWEMIEKVGNYSDQELIKNDQLLLYSTAVENLRELYNNELLVNENFSKKVYCNKGCAICKDSPDSCSLCEQGYYLDNSFCIKCTTLCKACKSEQICLSCIDNAEISNPLEGCKCRSSLSGNSLSNHCEPCQDPNCLNCEKNSKSCQKCKQGYSLSQNSCLPPIMNSRNLKKQNKIEKYKEKLQKEGVINAIKDTLKSKKLNQELRYIMIKDLESYINNQTPNKSLLEDLISIIRQLLNDPSKEAYKTEFIQVYAHTISKVLEGIQEVSCEQSSQILEIAEKIMVTEFTDSHTEYIISIIESLLSLYNEVGSVAHFSTDHIEVLKTENEEKVLRREKFLEGELKFRYTEQNFNSDLLVTIELIVLKSDSFLFHFNAYSNKKYINSTVIETNRTELVLDIPAKVTFTYMPLYPFKCEETSQLGRVRSCALSVDMNNCYFYEIKQNGVYRFSKHQKYSYLTISLQLLWLLLYPLSTIPACIKKKISMQSIIKENDANCAIDNTQIEGFPRKLKKNREFHLFFGFFTKSFTLPKVDRISIYISTLILQLCIQIILSSELPLPNPVLSLISVLSTLPFTLLHTYCSIYCDKKLLARVSVFLVLTLANLIVFCLYSPKDIIISVILVMSFDFILCQTALFLFIRRLNHS